MNFKGLIICFLLLLGGSFLYGQDIPVLYPATISTYDIDDGLPISCTEDGLLDFNGRLWINACHRQEEHQTIDFFQFDGEESFIESIVPLPKFSDAQSALSAITDKGIIYGFFRGTPSFFSFSPDQKTHKVFRLENNGSIVNLLWNPKRGIIIISKFRGAFQVHQFKDNQLKLLFRTPQKAYVFNSGNASRYRWSQALTNGDLWIVAPNFKDTSQIKDEVIRYNFDKDEIHYFKLPSNKPIGARQGILNRLVINQNGQPIIFHGGSNQYYRFDPIDNSFSIFELPSFSNKTLSQHFISKDEEGNLLFAWGTQGQLTSVLLDTEEKYYDYSPVLNEAINKTRFPERHFNYIFSKNFKNKIHLFLEGGVAVVDLKFNNSIKSFFNGHATRNLIEIDTNLFLAKGIGKQNYFKADSSFSSTQKLGFINDFCITKTNLKFDVSGFNADLKRDNHGNIWIGDNNGFHQITPTNNCISYPTPRVFQFDFLNDSTLFFGDEQSQLNFFNKNNGTTQKLYIDNKAVKLSSTINDLIVDASGNAWVATLEGLWSIDLSQNRVKKLSIATGLPDNRIMVLYQDQSGKIWVGTYNGGLVRVNQEGEILQVISKKEGLSNNTVIGILEDAEGYIWASTYHGLNIIGPDYKVFSNLFEKDGLSTNEFNRFSFYKTLSGKLVFGSINGLNVITPTPTKKRIKERESLKIYLKSIVYFDKSTQKERLINSQFDNLPTLRIPPIEKYVQIKFGLSNYQNIQENRYFYKIESEDRSIKQDWSIIGTNNELTLSNLPIGKYNILIKGRDFRGNESQNIIKIPIQINDFFYRTPLFYFICALLLASIIYYWFQRQKIEQKKLQRLVDERTQDILEAQQQLIVQEKLASLGQLTAGIAHEIKNPLNFVNNFAEGSVELIEDLEEEIKESQANFAPEQLEEIFALIEDLKTNAKDIQRNGTRADRIVKSMMDHARGTQSDQKLTDINEIIEDNINLAYHGYRAFDKQFFVQINRQLDPDLPKTIVYPQELGRVILNILNNACFAVNKKTQQGIATYAPVINVKSKLVGENIQIILHDNGIGIPANIKDKIFTPFFTTKSTGSGNTGLGLSISYDIIVQRHQGKISLISKEGVYTQFTIELPLNKEP